MRSFLVRFFALSLFFSALLLAGQTPQHLFFRVTLSRQWPAPVSGRILLFLTSGTGAKSIDESPFRPKSVYIAAKETPLLRPGESMDLDTDDLAFPEGFSSLKPGDYQAQVVLDVDHTYNYLGRAPGDLISPVVPLPAFDPAHSPEPTLTLDTAVPPNPAPPQLPPTFQQDVHEADFVSPALTAVFGRPIHLRAWVVLPPGYGAQRKARYPTVYWTLGFGGNLERSQRVAGLVDNLMQQRKVPPMIWVFLDESCPTGTHEFADSVNDGPWGHALTAEFIPWLEHRYRMDARPSGRLLQGHSSGGWATLQLQVNYPQIFGGTWSTSPDPSDFHDFTGIDLYAPHANVYHRPDGTAYPLVRDHDKVLGTFEEFAQTERVLGPYGGQLASLEWVFSPRGKDGRPMQMFDRMTGDVHSDVVAYWHDHYDLAHIVASTWKVRGPQLRGKIHVIVGTADTFYLDGPAHKFEAALRSLNAGASFTYIPNRTHFDLYKTQDAAGKTDNWGLLSQIARQMYAVARPGNHWHPAE